MARNEIELTQTLPARSVPNCGFITRRRNSSIQDCKPCCRLNPKNPFAWRLNQLLADAMTLRDPYKKSLIGRLPARRSISSIFSTTSITMSKFSLVAPSLSGFNSSAGSAWLCRWMLPRLRTSNASPWPGRNSPSVNAIARCPPGLLLAKPEPWRDVLPKLVMTALVTLP